MSAASDENKASDGSKTSSEEESRGVKRAADKSELNVHTANEWEHAKLEGGDQRKMKFLRLMGAAKKDPGKAAGGESEETRQHGRSDKEEQELKSKLEKQFEDNLEYKLTGGARKHKGLGFSEEDKEETAKETSKEETANTEKSKAEISSNKEEEEKSKDAKDSNEKEEKDKEKSSGEEKKTDGASAKNKFSMSFVKASS